MIGKCQQRACYGQTARDQFCFTMSPFRESRRLGGLEEPSDNAFGCNRDHRGPSLRIGCSSVGGMAYRQGRAFRSALALRQSASISATPQRSKNLAVASSGSGGRVVSDSSPTGTQMHRPSRARVSKTR